MKNIFLLLYFLCFFVPLSQAADLTLNGGNIRSADSLQVGHNDWARISFDVQNKSNRTRHVKIQVRHESKPEGVYEYFLDIPPRSRLLHYFPIAMGSAAHITSSKGPKKGPKKKRNFDSFLNNMYTMTLTEKVGNRYVAVKGAKPIECVVDFKDISKKVSVGFVSDERSQFGNLSKKLGYNEGHFRLSYIYKGKWPEHWSEYASFDMLIVMQPHYNSLNPLAIQALKNYVKMGGTLIFADPEGIIQAAKTDFEEILPIVPVGTRKVNHVPPLQKFLKSKYTMTSEFGMDFVEAFSKPDTLSACSWNGMEVVTWKKFGLGLVGSITLSPNHDDIQGTDGFKKIWQYFLKQASKPINIAALQTENASKTVNMLNGLTIPGPEAIFSYIVTYCVLALLLFIIFIKLKKPIIAWGCTLVLALGMTAFIFNKAYSAHKSQKAKTAAVFSQIPLISDAPAVKVYSIFSRNDEIISLQGNQINNRFKKLPKIKKMGYGDNPQQIAKESIEEIIKGSYKNGQASLHELNVRGLSTRVFCNLSTSHALDYQPATLTWKENGPTIESSEFPSEIENARFHFLVGPSGVIALTMNGTALTPSPNQAPHGNLDESLRSLLEELTFNRPILVAVIKDIKDDELLNDTYAINGLNLYMAPLKETLKGEVHIPGEFTKILGSPNSLFIYNNGKWTGTRHLSSYDLWIETPLGYESLKLDKLEVDLKYINQSGNIDVRIVIDGKEGQKDANGKLIFKDLSEKAYRNGRLKVTVVTKAKVHLTDNVEIHKANFWKIKHLKVALSGKIEQSNQTGF